MAGLGVRLYTDEMIDYVDFLRLDTVWKVAGREQAGIIVSHEIRDFGDLLRRVIWHLDQYTPAQQHDTLLWLGPGPRP